jgi:hypothetical protein
VRSSNAGCFGPDSGKGGRVVAAQNVRKSPTRVRNYSHVHAGRCLRIEGMIVVVGLHPPGGKGYLAKVVRLHAEGSV